jgi:precorrin-4 methylase
VIWPEDFRNLDGLVHLWHNRTKAIFATRQIVKLHDLDESYVTSMKEAFDEAEASGSPLAVLMAASAVLGAAARSEEQLLEEAD